MLHDGVAEALSAVAGQMADLALPQEMVDGVSLFKVK